MALLPTPANKTFEIDDSGWNATNAIMSRSTAQAKMGVASLLVDPTAPGGDTSDFDRQPASPSTAYTFKVWVFPVGGGNMRLGFNEFSSAVGGYLTTQQGSFLSLSADTWTLLEWTSAITQPTCAFVECFVARGAADSGDFYMDNVDDTQGPFPTDTPPVIMGHGAC